MNTTETDDARLVERSDKKATEGASGCCPVTEQTCCEPSAKSACCGTPDPAVEPPTRCGCR